METSKLILNGTEHYFTDDSTQVNGITKLYKNGEEYLIREYQQGGWQPGANTLLYYNFENDSGTTINNVVSGGINATSVNNLSISTLSSGKKIASFYNDGSSGSTSLDRYSFATNSAPSFSVNNCTFASWIRIDTAPSHDLIVFLTEWWNSNNGNIISQVGPSSNFYAIQFSIRNGYSEEGYSGNVGVNFNDGNWHLIVGTSSTTGINIYVDNIAHTGSGTAPNVTNSKTLKFGYQPSGETSQISYGEFILEDKVWSAQEVSDYYDLTKSLYGIS